MQGEDKLPVLDGTLNVYANAYEDSIETLRGTFPKLALNITGQYYIRFSDPIILARVLQQWDRNGDGGLTQNEANEITKIPHQFMSGDINAEYKNIKSLAGFDKLVNCTEIGWGAFELTNLEEAVFPPNLKVINHRAFYGTKIKKANLPDSCTYLGTSGGTSYMPFCNCSELEEFTMKDFILPDNGFSTQFVMNGGFNDCVNLKKFKLNKFDLSTVNPSYDRTLISFRNCVSLRECDFGEMINVNSMKEYAFSNTPITASFVPECITSMNGSYIYSNCPNLRVVVFEGNLEAIGQAQFLGTGRKLDAVIYKQITPPEFKYAGLDNVTAFYVPDESIYAYKTANGWSQKASIIYPLSTYNGYMPTKLYECDIA